MPPSGPPPASATPIFLAAELACFSSASRALRRVLRSCIVVLTGLLAKAPGPDDPGAFSRSPSVMDQRFDVRLLARTACFVCLRAALAGFETRRRDGFVTIVTSDVRRGNDFRKIPTAVSP